ncbi:MAG TPA: hypothetical protein VGQ83_29775 [Polyangia bacterium]
MEVAMARRGIARSASIAGAVGIVLVLGTSSCQVVREKRIRHCATLTTYCRFAYSSAVQSASPDEDVKLFAKPLDKGHKDYA